MALQSSGAISLDDIHVEVNGSSGSQCSINDSDIRGLIDKGDGATSAFNEFYGAANITYMAASGGTTSTSGNYKFHKFTSSGTFTVDTVASGGASILVHDVVGTFTDADAISAIGTTDTAVIANVTAVRTYNIDRARSVTQTPNQGSREIFTESVVITSENPSSSV